MRLLRTGDPCPCCGEPIELTDPEALRRLTAAAEQLGLPDRRETAKQENEPLMLGELERMAREGLAVWLDDLWELAVSNAPLTLDELREMDGDPVWISPAKKTGEIPARWMLVSGYDIKQDRYLFTPHASIIQGYAGKSYGRTWLAYRRKPEEGTVCKTG